MEVLRGEGAGGGGGGLAELLAAYRKRDAAAQSGLSQSQSLNREVVAGGGKGGNAERQAACARAFQGLECPVESLQEQLAQCGEDLQDSLKAMLLATQDEEHREQLAEKLVIPLSMACMEDASFIAGRRGKEITDFVVNTIDNLTPAQCSEVLEILLNNVSQDGQLRKLSGQEYRIEIDIKCFDFIPKLLTIASGGDKIKAGEMTYTGSSYKDYVVAQLYSISWPKRLVLGLADTIRCLRLSQGQLLDCAKKMLKEAKKMDMQDLPHLVYHSLLLSSQGHREHILKGIIELFNGLDEDVLTSSESGDARLSQQEDVAVMQLGEEELCQAESTVLQHFDFAVKQDQTLGQDILKILKQRQGQLSVFEVALLLQLSAVQRSEAPAFQLLRKAAEHDFSYQNKKATSVWVDGIRDLISPSSVKEVFRVVFQRTKMGWEHLVPGIVGFALHVLATCSRRGASDVATGTKTTAQALASLCTTLLERAFTLHMSTRDEILSQIFSRVITRDDAVPLFVSLLAKIASRCSRDVLDSLPKIKDAIEYISYMHPRTAVSFLSALAPIMRVQGGLHDYAMIVLRKALFSRESEARIVALDCMLHLATSAAPAIIDDRAGGSSSGRVGIILSSTDSLTIELIGQLRRCMAQQLHVRQRLYDGLCDVARAKPAMLDTIAGVLEPQLIRYVSEDKTSAQLQLMRCIDKDASATTTEPLPHLLRCTLHCVHEYSEILAKDSGTDDNSMPDVLAGGQSNLIRLSKTLERISEWLIKVDLGDFELDKCHADETDASKKLLAQGKLLIGVFEVLLEHAFTCHHVSLLHLEKKCFVLFQRMLDVKTAIKAGKAAKGEKGSKDKHDKSSAASQEPQTLLTMQYFLLLLSATNESMDSRHCDNRIEARARAAAFGNVALNVHALQSCLKQVQEMQALCISAEASTHVLHDIQRLAPLLLRQFYANLKDKRNVPPAKAPSDAASSAKKKSAESAAKPKAIGMLALEGVDACIHLACAKGTKKQIALVAGAIVEEILNVQGGQLLPEDSISQVGTAEHTISSCVRRFQDLIDSLLQEEMVEMASSVMSSMMTLLACLPSDIRDVSFEWFKSLCTNSFAIKCKASVLKEFVSLYLGLSVGEVRLQSAVALSRDVRIVCGLRDGDVDEGEQGDEHIEHGVAGTDEDEARCVIFALCDFVKGCCDEVDWVLAHVEMISRPDIAQDDEKSDEPGYVAQARANDMSEDEALVRLHKAIEVILPLAQCNLHMPFNAEAVISTLCRIYKTAETAARRLSSNAKGNPRPKFTSLMRTVGAKLNGATYDAIFAYTTIHQDDKCNMDVDDDGKKGSSARSIKAQISKELKLIPNIIFYIESLEKHLIKINQRAKDNKISVDLMKTFKPSKSRGFRIDFSRVPDKEPKEEREDKKGKGKKKKKKRDEDDQDGSIAYDDEEEDNRASKKKKKDKGWDGDGKKRKKS